MIEVRVPRLGLTMEEAKVLEWLKRVGDPIARDEGLVEIETEKATAEVPAPADGVVGEIVVASGETVPVEALLARIYSRDEWAAREAR